MKRIIYILAFTFLGLLVSTLLHAAIEMPTLWLISGDIETYGNSFVWQHWSVLHQTVGGLLWLLGALAGYLCGRHFWRVIYIEKRYGEKRW